MLRTGDPFGRWNAKHAAKAELLLENGRTVAGNDPTVAGNRAIVASNHGPVATTFPRPLDNGSAFNGRPGTERRRNQKDRSARLVRCSAGLFRHPSAEADDVAVRIFDVKVLRAPIRRRERLDDLRSVGNALIEKRLDSFNAGGRVKVVVVSGGACVPPGSSLLPSGEALSRPACQWRRIRLRIRK